MSETALEAAPQEQTDQPEGYVDYDKAIPMAYAEKPHRDEAISLVDEANKISNDEKYAFKKGDFLGDGNVGEDVEELLNNAKAAASEAQSAGEIAGIIYDEDQQRQQEQELRQQTIEAAKKQISS